MLTEMHLSRHRPLGRCPVSKFAVSFFAMLSLHGVAYSGTSPFADLAPGEWRELQNTKLQDVFPKQVGHPAWGVIGPRAVTATWSGGAYDTKRNVLIVTGGGHRDYGGNEVYEFILATQKWSRVTEPSAMVEQGHGRYVIADSEAPISSHTYDGLTYLPNIDRMFKYGGSYYQDGSNYDHHAYLFNSESKTWKRGAEAPQGVLEVVSDFDPLKGKVIVGTGNGLMFYDPLTDVWNRPSQRDNTKPFSGGALDTDKRLFVQVSSTDGAISFYNVDNLAGARQVKPLSGDIEWGKRPGIVYHPISKRMVIWSGGRPVWAFDTNTWAIQKFENDNGPAPFALNTNGDAKTAGVYGRWQYVPDYDLFIAYNDSKENVWLYKLPPRGFKEVTRHIKCDADLCVGPGQRYAKPSEAAALVKDGQRIHILPGNYERDVAIWRRNNITIRGVNGRPHMNAAGANAEGKGTWVIKGNNTTVENIEFSGAKVSDRNGAGIRQEGKNLTVLNCFFHDNENGILTGANEDSDIIVEHSEFAYNGAGEGQSHNIYVGHVHSLTVKFSYLHHAKIGHNLKSRAFINRILYNRIMDEAEGNSSYVVNLPNGGISYVIGNAMQQGHRTENNTLMSYGEEGLKQPVHELYVVNNTFVNEANPSSKFIFVKQGSGVVKVINNIFAGPGKILSGVGELKNNQTIDPAEFVSAKTYDYHLKPGCRAIDAGIDPGEANDTNLSPSFEYVHKAQGSSRKKDRVIDLGAFEQ